MTMIWQVDQAELRRKEEEAEREKAEMKKRATRDMFTRSIELAKEKRDKARHEEQVCDMKLLEQNMKATADETLAIQERKVWRFLISFSSAYKNDCFVTFCKLL